MPDLAVILPAAGRSVRFGAGRDKLLGPLGSVPVMIHGLRAFLSRPDARKIIIPTRDPVRLEEFLRAWQAPLDPRIGLCSGGDSRAQSVRNALDEVTDELEWVAIHDAARPLVSYGLIDRTLAAAVAHGAAAPAVAVPWTIKQAAGPLPARVVQTPPREQLWAMQTPQIMRAADLRRALADCPVPLDQITDDLQLLELAGQAVWLIPGEERNLKITTEMDLYLAEQYLTRNEDSGFGVRDSGFRSEGLTEP